jgi:hypothetical protein
VDKIVHELIRVAKMIEGKSRYNPTTEARLKALFKDLKRVLRGGDFEIEISTTSNPYGPSDSVDSYYEYEFHEHDGVIIAEAGSDVDVDYYSMQCEIGIVEEDDEIIMEGELPTFDEKEVKRVLRKYPEVDSKMLHFSEFEIK